MFTGQILLQLIVILLVVQVFGNICKHIGQQLVIGEILAGIALGPSFLGLFWPGLETFLFPRNVLPVLQTFGDIGLALYMFSLGSRLDTHLMLRKSRSAILISLSGIILPFLLGFSLAFPLYLRLHGPKATPFSFMLIVGTAMSITAFPVLARLLAEKKMLHTRIGTLALTCASIDDILAWCLLALAVSVIHSQSSLSGVLTIGLTIVFVLVMLFVVRPLLSYAVRHIRATQMQVTLSIFVLLASAYTTNAIGIHLIFGAFLAGVILPRNVPLVSHARSLDQVNNLLFLPLFFIFSGLQTRVSLIQGPAMWLVCLLLFAIACLGKMLGGIFATRVAGESWKDALGIGVLMNTRGLVELIALNIGLDLGVLSPAIFAMLVIMAIITTMMSSPLLVLLGYRSEHMQSASEAAVEQVIP